MPSAIPTLYSASTNISGWSCNVVQDVSVRLNLMLTAQALTTLVYALSDVATASRNSE